MFSKIFLSVLLFTYVYTYKLKSIEDNNDTNFQKMPDSLNFQLNEIKTVKPNLKAPNIYVYKMYLESVLGQKFANAVSKYIDEYSDWEKVFTEDVLLKMQECQNPKQMKTVLNKDILINLKNNFQYRGQEALKRDATDYQNTLREDPATLRGYIGTLIKYIEKNVEKSVVKKVEKDVEKDVEKTVEEDVEKKL